MMRQPRPLYGQVQGFNWHLRPEMSPLTDNTTFFNGSRLLNSRKRLANEDEIAGILIINGMKVLYLDEIAYEYVDTFLRTGQNHRLTEWKMAVRHLVSLNRVREDWKNLYSSLLSVSHGCCAGSGIELLGEDQSFSAPLRVDLALTYRCNNDCSHCYAGGSRETAELTTTEWCQIIAKLHSAGVPQVIFTGGESLLRPDLEELINFAKSQHMIVGLITNGRLLLRDRVTTLAKAGLDFVQITVESSDSDVHNSMVGFTRESGINALAETLVGVENVLQSTIQVTTNTTITMANADSALSTFEHLIKLGVQRIGVNGIIRAERGVGTDGIPPLEMKSLLREIRTLCLQHGVDMLWFTPTCYQQLNPISLELGVKSCSAASIVLAIEPTGQVIPCQSYFTGIGDARTDTFTDIWNHPLALTLRERQWTSGSCQVCKHFSQCGGGCPLEQGCGA